MAIAWCLVNLRNSMLGSSLLSFACAGDPSEHSEEARANLVLSFSEDASTKVKLTLEAHGEPRDVASLCFVGVDFTPYTQQGAVELHGSSDGFDETILAEPNSDKSLEFSTLFTRVPTSLVVNLDAVLRSETTAEISLFAFAGFSSDHESDADIVLTVEQLP